VRTIWALRASSATKASDADERITKQGSLLPSRYDMELPNGVVVSTLAAGGRQAMQAQVRVSRSGALGHASAAFRCESLQGSIAVVRRIDEAAACMYALQHEVLKAQNIPIQGTGRQPFRS
jgi:hypothetical protein